MARLYVKNRGQWRKWLQKNYSMEKEIWLVYYKKHTEKPTIPYADAVEEAICFGWIDSTVRKIDDEKYMQRYTPRNFASIWSELNIQRAKKMIKQKKMTGAGLAKFKKRKTEVSREIGFPDDLKTALMANRKAWENFGKLPPSSKKIWFWWVASAKKEDTKKRRIKRSVDAAFRNMRFPNG
ncbi:YdeI/OmpD-associated family protein [Candidatus Micrarchaeota archaeon]|nr:YdeI/OmpD-associated family protein [Candidatus Micrarchaeota archaeon]